MSAQVPAKTRLAVFLALLALLAVTRIGHFGTVVSLPDASLAVFLLGGAWLGGWRSFVAYATVGFGIDVFLAKSAVEAGWCLTPAYGGLVTAYGAVWLLGRVLARTPELPVVRYLGIGIAAVAVHFLIANISFWAGSGYFGDMAAADYALSVLKYLPPYLASTALYLAIGWIGHRIVTTRLAGKQPG
ncbi:MAG: DUF6580 family putative transport protein [Hydrogenophilaceae bacterium]